MKPPDAIDGATLWLVFLAFGALFSTVVYFLKRWLEKTDETLGELTKSVDVVEKHLLVLQGRLDIVSERMGHLRRGDFDPEATNPGLHPPPLKRPT